MNGMMYSPTITSSSPSLSQTITAQPQIVRKPNASRFQPATSVTNSTDKVTTEGKPISSTSSNKPEFSAGLKAYIERCFSKCVDEADREFASSSLKTLIAKISADGRLSVHRWDLEPEFVLPSRKLILEHEKEKLQKSKSVLNPPDFSSLNSSSSSVINSTNNAIEDQPRKRKNRWELATSTTSSTTTTTINPTSNTSVITSEIDQAIWSKLLQSNPTEVVKKSKGGILELAESQINSQSEIEMRIKRANRFNNNQDNTTSSSSSHNNNHNNNNHNNQNKQKKKKESKSNPSQISRFMSEDSDFDMDNLKIIGTCQKVEKDYLRLTSAPHPNTVRPEHVLKVALRNLITKWENKTIEYVQLCSQMKAIRQDLTVQHIQNGISVQITSINRISSSLILLLL